MFKTANYYLVPDDLRQARQSAEGFPSLRWRLRRCHRNLYLRIRLVLWLVGCPMGCPVRDLSQPNSCYFNVQHLRLPVATQLCYHP